MKAGNLYSAKLIIVLTLFVISFLFIMIGKATYSDAASMLIIIVPSYFALNEAGKMIREKKNNKVKKKGKLLSRKFMITLLLILLSTIAVLFNKATFSDMASFMNILLPVYFATNEFEKLTSFGVEKNEG